VSGLALATRSSCILFVKLRRPLGRGNLLEIGFVGLAEETDKVPFACELATAEPYCLLDHNAGAENSVGPIVNRRAKEISCVRNHCSC
jgi:hypothetical protein